MNSMLRKRETGFAQISNELLCDEELSLKAKGLYSYMFSKPQDWNFTIKSMSSQLKEGVEAIHTALRELRDAGWLRYIKHPDGTGTYILNVHKEPNSENPNKDEAKFGKPKLGFPERINNKDLYKYPLPPKGEEAVASQVEEKSTVYNSGSSENKTLIKGKAKSVRTKPIGFVYPKEFESLWPLNQKGDKWSAYKAWVRVKDHYPKETLERVLRLEAEKEFGRRHTSTVLNGDLDALPPKKEEWSLAPEFSASDFDWSMA